jgi:hypothetical protein
LLVVLGGGLEGVEAGPGEAADKALVDVGKSGVGQVVAQVVKVGAGPVGADGLVNRLGVGQGLVSGGDPEPVQDSPVSVVGGERAPSEYSAISAPRRLVAARWKLEHVEQVAVIGDVAAEAAGGN